MRKIAALVVLFSFLSWISPANAATPSPSNVGAYFKVEQGYMVNWTLPSPTTGITGYTVTASNGKTCQNYSAIDYQCIFPTTGFTPFVPYTFTVVANSKSGNSAPSAPSNAISWTSAPGYPAPVLTKAVSDTQIDVEWVPSTSTGGLSNYGYNVIRWEVTLNAYGDPNNSTRVDNLTTQTSLSATGLKPSTWYVFAVQQCNALGCTTSNWSYIATTPKVGAALTWRPPLTLNGGSVSTTCWKAVLDGGTAASTGNFTKSPTSCGGVIIDPSKYPVLDPTATQEIIPNLVNKFTQSIFLGGWQAKYSLATWGNLGLTLNPYLSLASKSVMRGYLIQPVIVSNTPSICSVTGMKVNMLNVGICTITASAPGNSIWLPTRPMTNSFEIIA